MSDVSISQAVVNLNAKDFSGELMECFDFFQNEENSGEDFIPNLVEDYLKKHTGKFCMSDFLNEVAPDVFAADCFFSSWEWDCIEVGKNKIVVSFAYTMQ